MSDLTDAANLAFRDYATDGVPASGRHDPVKAEIRSLFGLVDADVRAGAHVDTRTALKALDTTLSTAVFLTELGREGYFVFRAGNYSTQVTADTTEGIYLASVGVASTVGAWVRVHDSRINATWFGVQVDSASNQSVACQACINFAQTIGATAAFPAGPIKLTAAIAITGSCRVQGTGFEGDAGLIYGDNALVPAFPTKLTPWKGTVFMCGTANGAFTIATRQSVILEDFQVYYPAQPGSGIIAIDWDSAAGTSGVNTFSRMSNVIIIGSDIGCTIDNCLNFKHENITYLDTWQTALQYGMHGHGNTVDFTGPTNCALFGDSDFSGLFFNTVADYHVIIGAGGGLRFDNIKFNISPGAAVLVSPQPYVDPVTAETEFFIEPLIFGPNISWEGSPVCLKFQPSSTSNGICTQVAITGGQMWASTACIQFVAGVLNPVWITGVVITGVKMLFGAAPPGGEAAISFAGVENCLVAGCQIESQVGSNPAFSFPTSDYPITHRIRTSGNSDGANACLPAEVTPAMAASNVPVTNNNPHPVSVTVTGATKSGYVINGVSIDQTGGGEFTLQPGGTIAVVYTGGPPVWHWYAISP